MDITTAPTFADRTRPDHVQARFQFGVSGTKQSGIVYVTSSLSSDRAADILKAAKVAGRRAGATEVTIYSVGP
jgi:hypothetical protein